MRVRPVRYARKRVDLTARDLGYGVLGCLRPLDRGAVLRRLAARWPEPETVVPCLSVRSGFDLLLSAVDWMPGSEVIVSAVTIPHLATLLRLHGYVPVAVDVEPDAMLLDLDAVRRAVTPRTRALVYAHLFGARADLTALTRMVHECGLMMIEDRAQCFDGSPDRLGDADVAMYSFGAIKTASCLGGAVLLMRDAALRQAITGTQAAYPWQHDSDYLLKLLKGCLMVALGTPRLYAVFTGLASAVGLDYDAVVRHLSRGYSDRGLLDQIRRQPSTALLALLAHRFAHYDRRRVDARREIGDRLAAELPSTVAHLGGQSRAHTHWLFPVVSDRPDALVFAGRAAGFDLTQGSSTLVSLDPACEAAERAMRGVVYLPAYAGMEYQAIARLAATVAAAESVHRNS